MNPTGESPVELRCAVAIIRGDAVLLLRRAEHGDWVLPAGRPRRHESMGSCARRGVREETGLGVHPRRCALVLEVNDPAARQRLVELVFVADEFDTGTPLHSEPGREAVWVRLSELKDLALRPPFGGYLPELARRDSYARYLGNMWRPRSSAP